MPKSTSEPALPERKLISTTKAAEYLNVTAGYIRLLIAEGKLRGYKVGRLIKVDARDLEALIVTIDNRDVFNV
jgi:excisionase family DNA binding protein